MGHVSNKKTLTNTNSYINGRATNKKTQTDKKRRHLDNIYLSLFLSAAV